MGDVEVSSYIHTYIHTDRHTDGRMDGRTDGPTDRQTDRQTYIHTYIHKLYLSSDFSVAYKLVSPILITNFKSYSKNKAKKRKKIHNVII